MAKSVRRLGRGLDALVSRTPMVSQLINDGIPSPSVSTIPTHSESGTEARQTSTTAMVEIEKLHSNPYQPRESVDDKNIFTLAESLKSAGFIQPITVRPSSRGFEIIAGERRWLAAKSIGLTHVPVLVRQATDVQMIELALIENIQREDLNAIERAKAYSRFCDEFDLSAEQVARRLGEDRSTVVNYVRLLELSGEIRSMVADGTLSMGHARCLLGVSNEGRRRQLADAVVRNQMSVRALEDLVRVEKQRKGGALPQSSTGWRQKSAHVSEMERRFEERLKTKVVIEEGKRKGAGRIVVDYFSLDDFERIAEALGVQLE